MAILICNHNIFLTPVPLCYLQHLKNHFYHALVTCGLMDRSLDTSIEYSINKSSLQEVTFFRSVCYLWGTELRCLFVCLLCLLLTHISCHNTWTISWPGFSCGWLLIFCLACRRSTLWLGITRGNSLCAVTQMARLPHGMYALLPSLPRSLRAHGKLLPKQTPFQVPQVERFREHRINARRGEVCLLSSVSSTNETKMIVSKQVPETYQCF